jgi:oxaloacetate decarboxylase gamma subunit
MNDIGLALELMGVGMITVFIILSMVVLVGNLIIRFVNKFLPEKVVASIAKTANKATEFNRKKLAAVVTAVNTITRSKGRITKIEKI